MYDAVNRMLRNHVGRVLVVSRDDPKKLVGYIGRAEVMSARLRRIEEEYVREPRVDPQILSELIGVSH